MVLEVFWENPVFQQFVQDNKVLFIFLIIFLILIIGLAIAVPVTKAIARKKENSNKEIKK